MFDHNGGVVSLFFDGKNFFYGDEVMDYKYEAPFPPEVIEDIDMETRLFPESTVEVKVDGLATIFRIKRAQWSVTRLNDE